MSIAVRLLSFRVWMRAVRARFLLSSVIAVVLGGAVSWYVYDAFRISDLTLTIAGVLLLHASVDLLNDYRDYRRGIDIKTVRTGMSGGTGVLPEGLLKPEQVRRAGIVCLLAGSAIGSYYIYTHGIVIGIILACAVLSIYFYSTRIVDSGLGEIFVGIKGSMIVLGAAYVQTPTLSVESALIGAAAGTLSALVLFVSSFPDHDADKKGGRRTIVIRLGPGMATNLYWLFPATFCGLLLAGILAGALPIYVIISLTSLPLAILSGMGISRKYNDTVRLYPHMRQTLLYSRITGALLVVSLFISSTGGV